MKPAALPRCCIIGAGCSGIVTAKALADRGIPFDWFEMSDRIGGQWAFENPNGRSAAYRSLHIDTSKEQLQLSDYPDWPFDDNNVLRSDWKPPESQ